MVIYRTAEHITSAIIFKIAEHTDAPISESKIVVGSGAKSTAISFVWRSVLSKVREIFKSQVIVVLMP